MINEWQAARALNFSHWQTLRYVLVPQAWRVILHDITDLKASYGPHTVLERITLSVRMRSDIAIVFQAYNLFQNLNVIDNVMITPTKIKRWPRRDVLRHATELLERVGLSDRLEAYPDQLSAGQQQRVAIARARA